EYGNRQWRGEEVDCEIAVAPIPDKSEQWVEKRVIKVEGKVLAPLTRESPALAVGTRFQASIMAQASSGVIATTPKGNTLKIGQIKNFAYRERDWQGEEAKITVAPIKNDRGREFPLVTLDGNGLGILERESEMKLRERDLLKGKGFTLVARLENSPPTTAQVQIEPETVFYPWQSQEREQQMEAKRASFRERYEAYTAEIFKDSALKNASRPEIDVEVAVRTYADGKESQEVVAILSQSERVLEWRATVPDTRSWDDYVRQAKEYVRVIQNEAYERFQRQQPEKLKLQELCR
ncbi:hypothetical protein IQ238_28050, partial [Pleurocapsales cyanobacterium LEGE 06147]|nr:hypothetical protein [Pleurocapsales cyanobacterium LEGE 06147]